MASTNFREDFLGRDLQTPTGTAKDHLGRNVTATTDVLGRSLRRILRANTTAVTLNQELSFAGGSKYTVTIAGTTAGAEPGAPSVGATVVDGTATLLRTK